MQDLLSFSIEPKKFKRFLLSIQAVADQCRFKADKEGLKVSVVDNASVTMLDALVPVSTFGKFELNQEVLEFGFDIPYFLEFLKGYKKHYDLNVKIIQNDFVSTLKGYELKAQFSWTYTNGANETKTEVYKELPFSTTVDPSSLRKVPSFEYIKNHFNASFNVKREQFSFILAFCRSRGIPNLLFEPGWTLPDTMKLSHLIDEHSPDAIHRLSFKGELLYNVDVTDLQQKDKEHRLYGTYDVDYLSKIDAGIINPDQKWLRMDMCNEYTICFGKTYVIRIVGDLGGITVNYYLAPRIESD